MVGIDGSENGREVSDEVHVGERERFDVPTTRNELDRRRVRGSCTGHELTVSHKLDVLEGR